MITNQSNRVEHELVALFGNDVTDKSMHICNYSMMQQAELVAESARQLLQHKGQPVEQRRIIQSLSNDVAMALCRWIRGQ